MSANQPPDPYFSNINFNPNFFKIISTYLTETIANLKYLKLIGGILTGNLGIKRTPRVELDVSGKAIINTNSNSAPGNGILGSVGTKLILSEGTPSETPYAIGNESNIQWYGVPTIGSHLFYTGTTERMRINNSGNIGIGTNDPGTNKLRIYSTGNTFQAIDASGGTGQSGLRLIAGSGAIPIASRIDFLNVPASSSVPRWTMINDFSQNSTNDLQFTNAASSKVLTMTQSGNIGIGTNVPANLLHLHSTLTSQNLSIKITDATSGAGSTDGISILKTNLNDLFLNVHESARMHFFTNNLVRMNILANGNVGIGAPNPDTVSQIFQVGDGARLRISNSSTDYTLIGAKDGDDANNTKIVLSGHQRSGVEGNVQYYATTAGGAHLFYNNQLITGIISSSGLSINSNISLTSGTYRNGGFSVVRSGKFRHPSGAGVNGYFIDPSPYSNSLMICAFSHDSTSYQVWNGRISINKNGAITDCTNFYAPNSMFVDNFVELGSLKSWIYIEPNTTYNPATNLLAKLYG